MIARVTRQERNKRNLNQRERKLALFSDAMVLCIENPKESTKKPIRTNKFNKVAGKKNQQTKMWVSTHSQKAIEKKKNENQSYL